MGVATKGSVIVGSLTRWRPCRTSSDVRATVSSGLMRPFTRTGSSPKATRSKSEVFFCGRSAESSREGGHDQDGPEGAGAASVSFGGALGDEPDEVEAELDDEAERHHHAGKVGQDPAGVAHHLQDADLVALLEAEHW